MAVPIGTLGNVDTISMGGRVFTNVSSLIQLALYTSNASANPKATFRKPSASAGYQVTAGKTFTVGAYRALTNVLSGGENAYVKNILQSDNDTGFDGSTAFTNPVYFCGASAFQSLTWWVATATNQTLSENLGYGMTIAATKYVSCLMAGNAEALTVFLIGTEA